MTRGSGSDCVSPPDWRCDDNADAGPIPLDQPYPSGDDGYPFHVNCNCVEATIIDPDQMAKAENEDTELED